MSSLQKQLGSSQKENVCFWSHSQGPGGKFYRETVKRWKLTWICLRTGALGLNHHHRIQVDLSNKGKRLAQKHNFCLFPVMFYIVSKTASQKACPDITLEAQKCELNKTWSFRTVLKQNFAHQVLLASVFYCGTQNRVKLVITDISLAACSLIDSVWQAFLL